MTSAERDYFDPQDPPEHPCGVGGCESLATELMHNEFWCIDMWVCEDHIDTIEHDNAAYEHMEGYVQ